MMNNAMKK